MGLQETLARPFDFLLKVPEDDEWSFATIALILLGFGFLSFLINATEAPSNVYNLIRAFAIGLAATISLIALMWKKFAKPEDRLLNTLGFGTPITAFGGQLKKYGTPLRVAWGIFVALLSFLFIFVILLIFDPGNPQPGAVLSLGATGIQAGDVGKIINDVYFMATIETVFLTVVIYYSSLTIFKKLRFTRRLMHLQPFLTFVVLVLINGTFFWVPYHTLVYQNAAVGSADFISTYLSNLATVSALAGIWIILMQITKTVAAPLFSHLIYNWFAVSYQLGMTNFGEIFFNMILYIILPFFVLYSIATVIGGLLPRIRTVAI